MISLKHILCGLFIAIATLGAWGYEVPDSLQRLLTRPDTAPCEGVWQFADDGAVIAVVANTEGTYNAISLDSPDLYLLPGTLLGKVRCTAADATRYEWNIYTSTNGRGALTKKRKFTAEHSGTGLGNMSLSPNGINAKMNMWVLLRFFVRMSVRSHHKEKHIEARRIFPIDANNALNPIVL